MRLAALSSAVFTTVLAATHSAGAAPSTRYILWSQPSLAAPASAVLALPADLPSDSTGQAAVLLDRTSAGLLAVANVGSVVLESADGAQRTVLPLANVYGGRFSPDGSELTLVTSSCATAACESLYVVASDGTNLRRIADHASQAGWLPDGRVAYVGALAGNNIGTLTITDAAGAKPTQTLGGAISYTPVAPAPSPDGTLIAYQCRKEEICVSTTRAPRRLVTRFAGALVATPLWHGNTKLAMTLAGNYTSTTAVGTVATGTAQALTSPAYIGTEDTVVAWSPSGKAVLVQRRCEIATPCRDQVFSQNVTTHARRRLTNDDHPWQTVRWTKRGITFVTPPGP